MDYHKFKSVLILLVLFTLSTCNRCPMECDCRQDGEVYSATCYVFPSNHGFYNFDDSLPNNTISLNMKCIDVSHKVLHKPFLRLRKLVALRIYDCSIISIYDNAFSGLYELKVIGFYNVSSLPIRPSTFRMIPNLEQLEIEYSDWDGLSPNSCCMLNKIRILRLSGNNISSLSQVFKLCSHNQSFFSGLTELILNHNRIQILKLDFGQKLKDLIVVSLRGNKIEEIQHGALSNLSHLEKLDISENNIKHLPDDFLSGCIGVRALSVSDNPITKLPSSLRDLKDLRIFFADNTLLTDINFMVRKSLNIISMRNSSLNEIPPRLCETNSVLMLLLLEQNRISNVAGNVFGNCKNLSVLVLSSNNISILFNDSFKGLNHLNALNLSNNNISSFSEETFLNMINLRELDLHSNSMTNVPSLPLNISDCRIDYNEITNISDALYKLRKLQTLSAEHNLLTTIHQKTFPESVATINLANNRIKTVRDLTFANLTNLRKVDLRMNRIVTLSLQSVKVNSNLKGWNTPRFYISENQFRCDCELVWLKKDEIKWSTFCDYPVFEDLTNLTCVQHGKPWLSDGMFHEIGANRFLCEYKGNSRTSPSLCGLDCEKCQEICLCTHTYNSEVNYVHCKNKNLTNGIGIPSNAKWIDLSGNDLGGLSNKTLINESKAECLYLNNSKITRIGGESLTAFKLLKILHLQNNEIRMLYINSLSGLSKLKELNLSHNKIERIIPGTFNVTLSLELLDLRYNNLKQIDSQTFNVHSLKRIFLSNNPWLCNCSNLESMRSLNDIRPIDFKTVFCDQSNKKVIEYENDFCLDRTLHLYGVIIGLVFIVAVGITGIIMFVYKTEIKILLFVRFGWRILFKKIRIDEEDKKYDAFVSYHNSLDDFVINEMLPRLEGTNPAYKLCVHFRDFPAGATIVDNITECIENSKRTILLLNDQFLSSEWCKYEFQTAHLEALSNKLNTLIVVLLEDIDYDLVYGGLKLYLKTKTYLRYDDQRFWDKLRFALPVIKEENLVDQYDFV